MAEVLSRNLQHLMERKGMSMAALSRAVGSNQTVVYDIVRGRTANPRLDTVEKLAAALGVTPFDLLRSQKRPEAEQELLSTFSDLSERDQDRLLATARAWAAIRESQ